MKNKLITILMATYNGGMHIENQILSLQQQKYKNWILYIHDDGSTDNTLEIIRKIQLSEPRIKLIEDGIAGLGAGRNFLSMIQYAESDYVIFCDQDDIWLENKISEMVFAADNASLNNDHLPSILYADGMSFDSHSGVVNFESISTNHAKRINDFIFFNGGYQGCSILFNKAMVEFLKGYAGYIYHHDDLVCLIAHSFGQVIFLPKKLMLYRQHEKAVTGIKRFDSNPLLGKVDFIISRPHHLVKLSFYEQYKEILPLSTIDIFDTYIKYSSSNFLTRFYIALFKDITLGGSKLKFIFKTLLRRHVVSK